MTFFQSHRNKLTPDANLVVHTEISKEYKRNFAVHCAAAPVSGPLEQPITYMSMQLP